MYTRIYPATIIEVLDYASLLKAWRLYGDSSSVVAHFIVHEPLTPSEFRQLPEGLRSRLGPHERAVAWLEQLFSLHDSRK